MGNSEQELDEPVRIARAWCFSIRPLISNLGGKPITPFLRWDEKAGLRRDAIRSQCSTCSRHKEKETGYEKDYHCAGIKERNFQGTKADDRPGSGRSLVVLLRHG